MFDKIEPLKPNGNNEWILLRDREICGVTIKANSIGIVVEDRVPAVICWNLNGSTQKVNVWNVIIFQFLQPIIEAAESGDPYALERNEEQLCSLAEFLVIYSRVAQKISSEMLSVFRPLLYLLQR